MTGESWVLAIDFGTSFTVAASRIGDRPPEVIEIDGERRLPSIIMIADDGEVMVGKAAENLASTNPGRVLRAPKSRLGEPAPVVLGGRPHPITALVADLLRHVYRESVRYHGRDPDQVRLTHPATWSGPRRQQLLAAAQQAGLPDPVLVPEPVAAAIAYADEGAIPDGGHVLVYDLGGGTFDTAALQASPNGFVVVGRPGGDPRLGGELFDELLANTIGERLDGDVYERIQLAEDALWQQAAVGLVRESRRVKEALSSHPFADVLLGLPTGLVQQRVTQGELYGVIGPYIDESVDVMRQTVLGAGLDASDLSSIYLVGGASRTPLVEESVSAAYPDVRISRRGDPKGVVALGATHPRATPTSLAQRSSLDRASTLDRPGPPPPAAPVVAPVAPASDVPTAGETRVDIAAATGQAPTQVDRPGDATRVDATRIDSTRIDAVASESTVIDPAGYSAAPPAATYPTAFAPPTVPPKSSPTKWILAGAAALMVLVVGGIVLASRGGGGDDSAGGGTTESTLAVIGGGGGVVTPAPFATTTTPTTDEPTAEETIAPEAQTTTTAPATTTPSVATTAPRPADPTPTRQELEAALVTPNDLTPGLWQAGVFVPGEDLCGSTPGVGIVDEVAVQLDPADGRNEYLSHQIIAFDIDESADAEIVAALAVADGCTTTITVAGVELDVERVTSTLTREIIDLLPCIDDGGLIVSELTNDGLPNALYDFILFVRCGSNVMVVEHLSDSSEVSDEFAFAITAAAFKLDSLTGSN